MLDAVPAPVRLPAGKHWPPAQAPAGQVIPLHGSSTQTASPPIAEQTCPLAQPFPRQGSAAQTPAVQRWPGPQVRPAHGSGSQKPSIPHFWPTAQVTNVHAWTQSPSRQNVPLGQSRPAHGSVTQLPARHTVPAAQPAS